MGKNFLLWILFLVAIGTAGWFIIQASNKLPDDLNFVKQLNPSKPVALIVSPLDVTYQFDGKKIVLAGGQSQLDQKDTVAKLTTMVFGRPTKGDLNGDGVADYAMLATQDGGGSGIFFYVIVATTDSKTGEVTGSNAVLLGDRIAPQNIEIKNGVVIANYADRKATESFAVKPSVGVSKYIKLINGQLKESANLAAVSLLCTKNSGKWLAEYNECESGISEKECVANKGVFNECASTCRNDIKAQICNLMCVT
ncbi:MAG: hypothetical protein WCL61_03235, partial [bacterium]